MKVKMKSFHFIQNADNKTKGSAIPPAPIISPAAAALDSRNETNILYRIPIR